MKTRRRWSAAILIASAAFAAAGAVMIANSTEGRAGRTTLKFDFGPGKAASGYTQVSATTLYSRELGYGFEPGSTVTGVDRGGKDPLRSDFCTSDKLAIVKYLTNDVPAFDPSRPDPVETFKMPPSPQKEIRNAKFEMRNAEF
jgi:hypothetical protein